jgi:hypothetical protein
MLMQLLLLLLFLFLLLLLQECGHLGRTLMIIYVYPTNKRNAERHARAHQAAEAALQSQASSYAGLVEKVAMELIFLLWLLFCPICHHSTKAFGAITGFHIYRDKLSLHHGGKINSANIIPLYFSIDVF